MKFYLQLLVVLSAYLPVSLLFSGIGGEMTETERKLDLLLGDALAENERLRRELKYQDARDNHIGTHGPDCWTFGPRHYDCAIRHINSITDDGK